MPDSDATDSVANDSEQPIRVAGLCGSLRSESFTRRALEVALEGAREKGAETTLIDLRDYELVFCSGEDDEEMPADVDRLRGDVTACQGLILGTPEYHGSYSGVLKNAIDLMGFDEFEGKMLGLVGVSGGAMGGLSALASLRTIGRSLHAWVVPHQVTVPQAWKVFDKDGRIQDTGLEKRLRKVGREVARFAYLHGSEQTRKFLRLWEEAPLNPGA